MLMFKKSSALLLTLLCVTMLIAACGDAPVNTSQATTVAIGTVPAANAAQLAGLAGTVDIDGSSTVYRITTAAANEFNKYAKNVGVKVQTSGTSAGFRRFCGGEIDIQDASRPISVKEAETCKANSIEFIELPVAFDGLAVAVNVSNTWVDYLTVAELKMIWEPEAQGKITTWNQVRPKFPNRKISLYSPGKDSGTFDYFTAAIMGKEDAQRTDIFTTEDDYTLAVRVAGDPDGMSYFGYAYLAENMGKIRAVPVKKDDAAPAVVPSPETVKNGTYQPLSRPLFIYVKKTSAARPEVQAFVNFYLSKSFTPSITNKEIGYIPLTDNVYTAVAKRFNNGTTGTLFPKGEEVGATLDRYLK
jgi:phosphate transport system substrate-binding protein